MNQYFRRMRPKKMGGGAYLPRIVILSEAKNLCTLPSAAQTAAGIAKILRLAKKRGPQNDDEKTGRPDWTKRPGELQSVCGWAPPYFSSHFSSSRTLIFPCQGFLPRPWPSPGKTSSAF